MTIEEILDAFFRSRGLRRVKGASPEPLLPFLMMDCVYQMYNQWVAKLELKFEAKRYRKEWERAYSKMNMMFFRAFDADQTDEVIDMMDDFEEYINNDLVITKIAVMNILEENRTLEEQQVASSCLVGEVLCYSAMVVWNKVYKGTRQMDVYNQIDRIRKSIHRFINVWYKPVKHINMTDDPKCEAAINTLCRRMIRYLTLYNNRRKQQSENGTDSI